MSRWAAVLAAPAGACPPGVDPTEFARACRSDALELCSSLRDVAVALAGADPVDLGWPRVPMVEVPAVLTGGADVLAVLAGLAALGATEGVVVAGDAPDLPPLLVGKLLSALSTAAVAVIPAAGGGLVALAARLPAAPWLAVGLSTEHGASLAEGEPPSPAGGLGVDAEALRAAAPTRRDLTVTAGWHRLRQPADLARLDQGLDGFDALRLLLSAPRR